MKFLLLWSRLTWRKPQQDESLLWNSKVSQYLSYFKNIIRFTFMIVFLFCLVLSIVFRSVGLILISPLSHVEFLWIPESPTADKNAVLYRRRVAVKNKLLWRSSLIIFFYVVNVLLNCASYIGNPFNCARKNPPTYSGQKCARSIQNKIIRVFRRCCVNIISSLHSTTVSQYQLMETGGGGYRMLGLLCMCDIEAYFFSLHNCELT